MMNQSSVDSNVLEEDSITCKITTNDVFDNIPTKVITALTCVSILTIGNALWSGIIHFELYGGDPKKRSITNRLTSLASMVIMMDLNISQILYTARVFIGCYPSLFGQFYVFMRDLLINLWAGIFFLILSIKWIETFKFHLLSRLNDEFWNIFLSMWMIMIQLGYISFREIMGFHETSMLKFISCIELEVKRGEILGFLGNAAGRFLPTYVYFPSIFFFVSSLTWKKIKDYRLKQDIVENLQHHSNFNNCMYNPAIFTPVQYCMYFIVIGGSILLALTINDVRLKVYPWLIILRNAPHIITIGIIVPLIFYSKNKSARSYIKREFWNWAPDCVQKYNPYQPQIHLIMNNSKRANSTNQMGWTTEVTNENIQESDLNSLELVVIHEEICQNEG